MANPNLKTDTPKPARIPFSRYEIFMIVVIAFIQFTVILDFMVLSPLSAILLDELKIEPDQFSLVVSAYAFSAGISGLLAAGFADKFDRKLMLMFFYTGFVLGTALCAMADTYEFLLMARIITGIFGGVIGSIGFAIITDIFKLEVRGRVMGFVQMAFAVSQVMGLPIGIYLAKKIDWHAPFWMIVGLALVAGIVMFIYMKPINDHLKLPNQENPIQHFVHTLSNRNYLIGFSATVLMATGGYMLMPFGAAYSTANLGIPLEDLPLLYMVTGIFTIFVGPIAGRLSDRIGKYNVFIAGCIIALAMVGWYTNLQITPLWLLIAINVILFAGLTARMISGSALMSAVPDPADRGAFMGINSSIQQISGGVAAIIAGQIVVKRPDGYLENYPILGIVVMLSFVATIFLFGNVNRVVRKKILAAADSEQHAKVDPMIQE